ncbi:MAG: ParB/RepB/Spo0J family partition protein [Clostridia bacterium]|nr:ParB/RepB/Spo0J family partition protein [Clostridia bacterium]
MKKGLGKGLGTLFSEELEEVNENGITMLKITQVEPNKNQPRKNFDMEKLEALSESIKEHGMIQPIIVTKNDNDRYVIVAGERRWRASKLAGLTEIPVIVKEYSKKTVAEIALIENLQREDLNPIEEAMAYKELCETHGLTQDQISQKVGKSRSAVANSMRLLSLENEFQTKLISGEISEGHARTVLSLENYELREFLINQIISNGLNVRQSEVLAKQLQKSIDKKKEPKKIPDVYNIELQRIQERLSTNLGTKVTISNGAKKGKIEIEYYGNEDLDRLLNLLKI